MKHFIIISILIGIMSMPVFAADAVKSEQLSDLDNKGNDEMFSLSSMSCGDIFYLFDDADPDNKEAKPEDITAAQDDVLMLFTWVHGYISGRDGIDTRKHLMNKAGIEKTLTDIVTVCKDNEDKTFLDVIPNLK